MFLPSKILGRGGQAENLLEYLSLGDGFLVPFISVYGRSGSGKSTVVKLVCDEISDVAETRFVNLRKARTIFGCANLILSELGSAPLKGASGLNCAVDAIEESICHNLERQGKRNFVLVLDEYDVIFSDRRGGASDFVYKLLRISENLRERGLWLCVVGISNGAVDDFALDDRVKSRIGSNSVFFEPYKKDEIVEILRDRAQKAFSIKIPDEIFQYCAELSSADHGDARRALDLLRVTGELCNGHTITREDVDTASEKVEQNKFLNILQQSSDGFKKVFCSLVRISYLSGHKWHSTSIINKQYCRFLLEKDEKRLSYRRIFDILGELEQSGLVVGKNESEGRYGYSRQYMVVVSHVAARYLFKEKWEKWEKIKKARFVMMYKPRGNSHMANLAKYEDMKSWHQLLGLD